MTAKNQQIKCVIQNMEHIKSHFRVDLPSNCFTSAEIKISSHFLNSKAGGEYKYFTHVLYDKGNQPHL